MLCRGAVALAVLFAASACGVVSADSASEPTTPMLTVTTLTFDDPAIADSSTGSTSAAVNSTDSAADDQVATLDDVVAFADLANLETVIALDARVVHVAYTERGVDGLPERRGHSHEVAPLGWAWSDGDYVFQWVDDGDGALRSTAATFDGTIICEADGSIHHFDPPEDEAGRSGVMAVEASPSEWQLPTSDDAEFAIPLTDVDCETGEAEPGESVSFRSADGFRFTKYAGPRTFRGVRDTNGIATLFDDLDRPVNGDDPAIDHKFNINATIVAYGVLASPDDPSIVTDVIRVRVVDTGEILWTVKLPFPFTFFHFADDRLVVGQPDRGGSQGGQSTASVLLFDVRDGSQLGHFAAPFEVLSVGG